VIGTNRDSGLIQTPFIWAFDARPAKMTAATAAKNEDAPRANALGVHSLAYLSLLP
jgi:hypothetical protein